MSTKHDCWVQYWRHIAGPLEKFIQSRRNVDAEKYISCCFAFFSFVMEDFEQKLRRHKSLNPGISPMMVELQDIARGAYYTQCNLLMASSAFNLRTAFEIRCTLSYIFKHTEPSKMVERLANFSRYEQIVSSKKSRFLEYEGEIIEKQFADAHPYWKNKSTGLLKEKVEWNGEGKSIKDICEELKWMHDYFHIYKLTSKFHHASPVVKNVYQTQLGMTCLADPQIITINNIQCAHQITNTVAEACAFFGVDYPKDELLLLHQQFLSLETTLAL